MMKTLKSVTIALSLGVAAVAVPAMAQNASSTGPTMVQNQPQTTTTTPTTPPPPVHCFGNLCGGGNSGFNLDVIGAAAHAGEFAGVFNAGANGTGSVETTKKGGSMVDLTANINTCDDADCASNSITGTLNAFEMGTVMVTAQGNTAGEVVSAVNYGTAQAAIKFGVIMTPAAMPTQHPGTTTTP